MEPPSCFSCKVYILWVVSFFTKYGSVLALIEVVDVVFVFKMNTISFVAQLTVMSYSLTGSYQSCCWDSFARLFPFML
jgi:hypothetical protein